MVVNSRLRKFLSALGVTGAVGLGMVCLSGGALADSDTSNSQVTAIVSQTPVVSQSSTSNQTVSNGQTSVTNTTDQTTSMHEDQANAGSSSLVAGATTTLTTVTGTTLATGSTQPTTTSVTVPTDATPVSPHTATPAPTAVAPVQPVSHALAQAVTSAIIAATTSAVVPNAVLTPTVIAAAQAASKAMTTPTWPLPEPGQTMIASLLAVLLAPIASGTGHALPFAGLMLAVFALVLVTGSMRLLTTTGLTYADLLRRGGFAAAARSDAGARPTTPLLMGYTSAASMQRMGGPFLVGLQSAIVPIVPTLMKGGR